MDPQSGAELKKLREAKGLALDDVAQGTRLRTSILEAIESDLSSDLLSPVYQNLARGTYARFLSEAVGKDPSKKEPPK